MKNSDISQAWVAIINELIKGSEDWETESFHIDFQNKINYDDVTIEITNGGNYVVDANNADYDIIITDSPKEALEYAGAWGFKKLRLSYSR